MLLKSGKSTAAIRLVIEARDKAKEEYGAESPEYAEALYDHGSISILLNQYEYAVESLKIAIAIPPSTEEMKKKRLNYLLNLGEILTKMREYSKAEDVLRRNLKERAEYYGTDRGAYGFALDSLARVLIKVKKYSEAETLASQAVEIFRNEGNPQVNSTIAFRGLCTKAAHGTDKPAFPEFKEMQPEHTSIVYDNCVRLAEEHEPHYSTLLLYDLRESLLSIGHANDTQIFMIGMEIDLLSRKLKENAIRIKELTWTLEISEKIQGRPEFLAELQLALGVAYSDVGDFKTAEKAFKNAESRASDAKNKSIHARILRNFALMVLRRGKPKDAKKLLEKGLKFAKEANDSQVIGRLQLSLGIVLFELGKGLDGNIALHEGLMKLPRIHPDRILAHATMAAPKIGLKILPSDNEEEILALAVRDMLDSLMISQDQIRIKVKLDGWEYPEIDVEVSGIPEREQRSADSIIEMAKSDIAEMYLAKGKFIPL